MWRCTAHRYLFTFGDRVTHSYGEVQAGRSAVRIISRIAVIMLLARAINYLLRALTISMTVSQTNGLSVFEFRAVRSSMAGEDESLFHCDLFRAMITSLMTLGFTCVSRVALPFADSNAIFRIEIARWFTCDEWSVPFVAMRSYGISIVFIKCISRNMQQTYRFSMIHPFGSYVITIDSRGVAKSEVTALRIADVDRIEIADRSQPGEVASDSIGWISISNLIRNTSCDTGFIKMSPTRSGPSGRGVAGGTFD